MKYSHFETLALVLGTGAIVASIFIAPTGAPQSAEVAAQLLLIVVLGGALHWGRGGGFLTALVAIAIYVGMRVPLMQSQGLSGEVLSLLATRAVTYALVGVVGGELAARIKYIFAKLQSESLIDPVTGVYSARYAADSILSGVGQYERYHTDYSVVTIVLAPGLYVTLRASGVKRIMRQAAGFLRNDIRMVDDLASGPLGTFHVMLPRTDGTGASVVSERLATGLREQLGARDDAVTTTVLSASSDAHALRALAESLSPTASAVEPVQAPEPDRRASAPAGQEPVA